MTNESHTTKALLKDFTAFARRTRLQFIFYGIDKKPLPFHVKSNWEPPVQPSVTLQTYLEELKTQMTEIQISKPKNNLPTKEPLAIKEMKQNPNINIKKRQIKVHLLPLWIKTYLQTHGTAMGTKMAVAFANIFMSAIETEIIRLGPNKPLVWKRYIYDIFSLWNIHNWPRS